MTENKGITVRYTKDGKSHQIFIEEILLLDPKNVMYEPNKQQFITAAKELLTAQQGPGGEFEIIESLSSKPPLMLDDKRILAYDEEHEVFILKLDLDKLQTVRSGLIEMFDKRDTLNWKDAGRLFHQLTSEMREMDRLPGVPANQPNISYDLTDRKLIKLSCTECGEFVRELIPEGQSRAITNDRIWHLAGEHTREKHSRDDSLNWTGKLEEKK